MQWCGPLSKWMHLSKWFLLETEQVFLNNLRWRCKYASVLPSLPVYKCFYTQHNKLTWAEIVEQFQSVWRFSHREGAVTLILKLYAKQCLFLKVRQTWQFCFLMRDVGEEVWKAPWGRIICAGFMFYNQKQ